MDNPAFLIVILVVSFVLTSFYALFARRLIWIITAIGAGSVILSVVFFIFGASFAGAFELSVGAGLISVLFIIATSLTKHQPPSSPGDKS